METLYTYVNTLSDWDGHVHLFNHKNPIPKNHGFEKCVGFMDIEYDDIDNINVLDSYKDYITNHWDKEKEILLATGITFDDIKAVYDKYPKVIKGFGELKLYDMYRDKKLPYKKISLVKQVAKFSESVGYLPIYIHWELTTPKDVAKLEEVLSAHPLVPIVLCHMGMNEENRAFAFVEASRLQKLHNNLWLDISWDGVDFLSQNPMQSNMLVLDRIVLGTDLNNRIFEKKGIHKNRKWDWGFNKYTEVQKYLHINNKSRLQTLFGKEPK